MTTAVGRLPVPVAAWLGRRFGDVAFLVLGRRRRIALANLRQAFPEASPAERGRLCRQSFQHLGLMAVELCALLARSPDQVLHQVRLEGGEHLDAAVARHGRALLLTAHLGNWELLAVARRLTGYDLAVVVRPLDAPWLGVLADRVRRKGGVELIPKRQALRRVLHALGRGRLVGILLDQNASRREGVFVPFFGRPASTSRAVAVLALRTRTPIIPVFARREGAGRHRVVVHPPLEPPAGRDSAGAVVELTGRCTALIEAAVRATPEQWLWVHDRWRTRPPAGE